MIRGVTITLISREQTGTDAFNSPTFDEKEYSIDNVLIGEPSTDDATNILDLYGKRIAYTLGIPKGDNHHWEDGEVILPKPFDGKYRVIGHPTAGIDAMIPLAWNKKVQVERYD